MVVEWKYSEWSTDKKIIVLKSVIGVKLSKHGKSIRKVNETEKTESGEKLKFLTHYINL